MKFIFALLFSNVMAQEPEMDLQMRREEIINELEGLVQMQKQLEQGEKTEYDGAKIEAISNALMNENDWII